MGDIGIKVSQVGYDVDSGDKNQIYSSGWPTPLIETTGVVRGVDADSDNSIVEWNILATHNLGYPPLFFIWQFGSNGTSGETGPTPTRILYTREWRGSPVFAVDSKNLYFRAQSDFSFTLDIRYYITRLQINQNFQAPNYSLGSGAKGGGGNFGFKVAKEGADINSSDLRDFNLHSSTRGPQVHAVTTGLLQPGPDGFFHLYYTPDLPTTPLYMGFETANTADDPNDPSTKWVSGLAFLNSTGQIELFSVPSGTHGSIIVFKDPFAPDEVIQLSL